MNWLYPYSEIQLRKKHNIQYFHKKYAFWIVVCWPQPCCWGGSMMTHLTKGLWFHYWNLTKILFALNFNCNVPIWSQFCTCHDSSAVMTCAKLWPDWIIFKAKATFIFFYKIGIMSSQTLCETCPWPRRCKCVGCRYRWLPEGHRCICYTK